MSTDNDHNVDPVVAFVSGTIIGVAVTLLLVRMQGKLALGSKANDEGYYYDGGDLFI